MVHNCTSEVETENSEIKDLSRLLTREDYLINQRRESFKSYIYKKLSIEQVHNGGISMYSSL